MSVLCGPAQISHATTHDEQQPIAVRERAKAHETRYFDRATALDNKPVDRLRTGCEAPCIPTQQIIWIIAQVALHPDRIEQLYAFQ